MRRNPNSICALTKIAQWTSLSEPEVRAQAADILGRFYYAVDGAAAAISALLRTHEQHQRIRSHRQ